MRCLALAAGILALSAVASHAIEPSFDCSRASNAVERAICANDEFAAMDLELAGLYRRALITFGERTPEGVRILQRQRAWLSEDRNSCATIPQSDYRFLQCIGNAYGRRIAELREMLDGGTVDVTE